MESLDRSTAAARGHPVWAEIDLQAIRDNVGALRARAPSAEVMGVVKGYAYGHGNPAAALAILEGGASRLGVARVAEALHLREAGVDAPIQVFTEPPPEAAAAMVDQRLTATVYTDGFARALSDAASQRDTTIPVHVKIDTGMHRVGLPADDVPDAMGVLRSLPGLTIEGAWSHLAVADVPDHPFTRKQMDVFLEVTDAIERSGLALRYKHIANSAATLALPETHLDLVRCGVACFGLYPTPEYRSAADLRPAMSLRARVNMIKRVPAGEAVSYGLNYQLSTSSNIVTVPAGYADGYARGFSGIADVLLRGRRYRLSGTVCMDQFMVDVGDDLAEIGDVVTLLGTDGAESVTAEELASMTGTINYEVVSRVPSRVPRIYLNGGN